MRAFSLPRSAVLRVQAGGDLWGRQGPNCHIKRLVSSLD